MFYLESLYLTFFLILTTLQNTIAKKVDVILCGAIEIEIELLA